jgi:tetratricopeptide (TPR) repeat protein
MAATGLEAYEHADEYHRRVVALESALSPRDHALLDCLEQPAEKQNEMLDSYLARYPGDDVAWVARVDDTIATTDRALAADPTLVPLLQSRAALLRTESRDEEAAAVLARCLDLQPRAVACLKERATLRDLKGECAAAEADVRRWLDLQPDSREAPPLLAGLLAAQGAPVAAVREALGADPHGWGGYVLIFDALIPLFEGDFAEVERRAQGAIERVPAGADESTHFMPTSTLVSVFAEEGDLVSAARVAVDYVARRAAWKDPDRSALAFMLGTAVRGGLMDPTEANRRLDATYQEMVSDKTVKPSQAWANVYARAAETRAEALRAVAKLDTLHVNPSRSAFAGALYSASRNLFLASRADDVRAIFRGYESMCTDVLLNSRNWARQHVYVGELDEQAGSTASACGHYGKVLKLWEHAKPRSVTADEARARFRALGCPQQ